MPVMGQKNRNCGFFTFRKTPSKKQYYYIGKISVCVYPHKGGLRCRPLHGVIHTLSQSLLRGEKRTHEKAAPSATNIQSGKVESE